MAKQKQNFWQKLFNITPEQKSIDFRMSLRGLEPPDPKTQEQLSSFEGWTYACVSAIAEEVSKINFRLFQMKGGEVKEVETHPIIDLLNRVNPFQTKADFIHLHQTYMDMAGESFWLLERGKDNPKATDPVKELWLLRPDLVEVIPDSKNFIKGYIYRLPSVNQKSTALQPFEVIHFKSPNPLNPYRGFSPVKAGALSIDVHKFASLWNRNFFFNSARPDGLLKTGKTLTDAQWKRLQGQWESMLQGVSRAQRVAILEDGLDYQQLSLSAKDMDFSRQKEMTRDEILANWRVPKSILGITDDVNRANAEATIFAFARFNVKPKMSRIVDTLNEFLVPLFGQELWLDYDDPVPDDRAQKVNEYAQGWNKWLTINDIREAEGLPPVDGGDVIYQPFSNVPVGEGGFSPVNLSVMKTGFVSPKQFELKKKMLAGKSKLQLVERLRSGIQSKIDEKMKLTDSEDEISEEKAKLIHELSKAEAEIEFHKLEADKAKQNADALAKENEELKTVAQDAIDITKHHDKK